MYKYLTNEDSGTFSFANYMLLFLHTVCVYITDGIVARSLTHHCLKVSPHPPDKQSRKNIYFLFKVTDFILSFSSVKYLILKTNILIRFNNNKDNMSENEAILI